MMTFELIQLPYAPHALEPVVSAHTIGFHYGKDKDGKLVITQEPNAANPLVRGLRPLLTFDVWGTPTISTIRTAGLTTLPPSGRLSTGTRLTTGWGRPLFAENNDGKGDYPVYGVVAG